MSTQSVACVIRGLLAAAIIIASTPAARATDIFFNVANGDFTLGSSWAGGIAPGPADRALINNGGNASLSTLAAVDRLYIGSNLGTTGSMVMTAGQLDLSTADLRVGDLGTGTFNMRGGIINHGNLASASAGDINVGRSGTGSFNMSGNAVINAGGSMRVARGASGVANATLTMTDDAILNTGDGIVVGRGDAFAATGTFTIGGSARYVAGNSLGDGNPAGTQGEGFFSVANLTNAVGHVTVKEKAIVKSLRLTGRQGKGDITIQDDAQFYVVNTLDALGGGPSALYGSYLGGGSSSNGDGNDGASGLYTLTLKGNGLLSIDANNFNRDPNRPELQGFQLGRGNATANALIQDKATLIVYQRFIIGGLGRAQVTPTPIDGPNLNGFDGKPDAGIDTGGTATVTMTGGLLSTDQLIVGGTGTGTLTVTAGVIETKPYDMTNDPDAGSAKTSVDSIRIGMLQNSKGTMNVGGTAKVTTGADLGIGQYGDGTLKVTGGAAGIQAKDVYVQKFKGSTGTLLAEITGNAHTPVNATDNVTINGGTFAVLPTAVPPSGAHKWTILRADSDNDTVGALTGKFDTTTLPAGLDAIGRKWSKYYTVKEFVVGLTRPGDANYDGTIDFNDLVALAQHYNSGGNQWPDGDFTDDGLVDFNDLVGLAQNYNTVVPAAPVPGASPDFNADLARAFANVPEPSTCALIAACGFALLAQRQRHRTR